MAVKFTTGADVELYNPALDKPIAPYGGEERYQLTALVGKDDAETIRLAREAIAKATEDAVNSIWGGQRPAKLNDPLKDGDTKDFDFLKGHYIIDAKTKLAPKLFHLDGTPASADEFQSGATIQAELSIYAFNYKGLSMGLGAGIERVWLVKPSGLQNDNDNVAPVQAEQNKADNGESGWSFLN